MSESTPNFKRRKNFMNRKNGLISIGELSKLTGASVRSLRYYEKLNLLIPTHIDEFSRYRYYSLDQAYHVEIIMFCVELDIPLKELMKFTTPDDILDFRAFLTQAKEIAEEKLKKTRKGLLLIRDLEQKMDLAEQNELEEIYERKFPQKYFYVKLCGDSLQKDSLIDLFVFFEHIGDINDTNEYGYMCEQSENGVLYYAFVEVSKQKANKIIPAGKYFCRQSDNSQIEKTCELFGEYFTGSYLAIETEIFIGKHKISKPLSEVRVLNL